MSRGVFLFFLINCMRAFHIHYSYAFTRREYHNAYAFQAIEVAFCEGNHFLERSMSKCHVPVLQHFSHNKCALDSCQHTPSHFTLWFIRNKLIAMECATHYAIFRISLAMPNFVCPFFVVRRYRRRFIISLINKINSNENGWIFTVMLALFNWFEHNERCFACKWSVNTHCTLKNKRNVKVIIIDGWKFNKFTFTSTFVVPLVRCHSRHRDDKSILADRQKNSPAKRWWKSGIHC